MPTQQGPEGTSDGEIPSLEVLQKWAVDILRSGPARGWQPADWEDMAQEVLLKVIVAQETGRLDPERFQAWFITVVRRVATDYWRARYGRHGEWTSIPMEEANEPEDVRAEAALAQFLAKSDVQAILDHTPGLQYHERAILKLIYWYDFSYRDLADVFGVPEGTVRSWNFRMLRKLHEHWEKGGI